MLTLYDANGGVIMPGFMLEISIKGARKNFGICRRNDLLVQRIEDKKSKYYIERRTVKKFLNDKVFYESPDFIVLTEGVILNRKELERLHGKSNFAETVIAMYQQKGEDFFKEFRGPFSGLLYDKVSDKWIVYTNHYGDKQIFYYVNDDVFLFGSEVTYLTSYLKNNGIPYSFNIEAAYMLLTHGYMLEDNTLIKEIRKLPAGHYVVIDKSGFRIKTYFEIDNEPDYTLKEDEIIEELDSLFRKAVRLEFDKDKEYGYRHLASLSGGLDSRMTVWVAHEEGYDDILIYTFSQSDYLDEKIAKKIAADLGYEFLFKSLDNGVYLMIDDMVRRQVEINFGNCLYSGNAHVRSFADIVNLNTFGLVHTGQLGDVIVGTYSSKPYHEKNFELLAGAYSFVLKDRLSIKLNRIYKNEEEFKMLNRGFNGILQGNMPFQQYTEVVSPFLDVDFFKFCMKVPVEFRFGHRIYFKWILKKHPKAANYKWEKIRSKITTPQLSIFGRKVPITQIIPKITRKVLYKNSLSSKHSSMNPLDYWYRKNPKLREYFERKFHEGKIILTGEKELLKDIERMYSEGGVIEKTQVLTLLEAYKYYFLE